MTRLEQISKGLQEHQEKQMELFFQLGQIFLWILCIASFLYLCHRYEVLDKLERGADFVWDETVSFFKKMY